MTTTQDQTKKSGQSVVDAVIGMQADTIMYYSPDQLKAYDGLLKLPWYKGSQTQLSGSKTIPKAPNVNFSPPSTINKFEALVAFAAELQIPLLKNPARGWEVDEETQKAVVIGVETDENGARKPISYEVDYSPDLKGFPRQRPTQRLTRSAQNQLGQPDKHFIDIAAMLIADGRPSPYYAMVKVAQENQLSNGSAMGALRRLKKVRDVMKEVRGYFGSGGRPSWWPADVVYASCDEAVWKTQLRRYKPVRNLTKELRPRERSPFDYNSVIAVAEYVASASGQSIYKVVGASDAGLLWSADDTIRNRDDVRMSDIVLADRLLDDIDKSKEGSMYSKLTAAGALPEQLVAMSVVYAKRKHEVRPRDAYENNTRNIMVANSAVQVPAGIVLNLVYGAAKTVLADSLEPSPVRTTMGATLMNGDFHKMMIDFVKSAKKFGFAVRLYSDNIYIMFYKDGVLTYASLDGVKMEGSHTRASVSWSIKRMLEDTLGARVGADGDVIEPGAMNIGWIRYMTRLYPLLAVDSPLLLFQDVQTQTPGLGSGNQGTDKVNDDKMLVTAGLFAESYSSLKDRGDPSAFVSSPEPYTPHSTENGDGVYSGGEFNMNNPISVHLLAAARRTRTKISAERLIFDFQSRLKEGSKVTPIDFLGMSMTSVAFNLVNEIDGDFELDQMSMLIPCLEYKRLLQAIVFNKSVKYDKVGNQKGSMGPMAHALIRLAKIRSLALLALPYPDVMALLSSSAVSTMVAITSAIEKGSTEAPNILENIEQELAASGVMIGEIMDMNTSTMIAYLTAGVIPEYYNILRILLGHDVAMNAAFAELISAGDDSVLLDDFAKKLSIRDLQDYFLESGNDALEDAIKRRISQRPEAEAKYQDIMLNALQRTQNILEGQDGETMEEIDADKWRKRIRMLAKGVGKMRLTKLKEPKVTKSVTRNPDITHSGEANKERKKAVAENTDLEALQAAISAVKKVLVKKDRSLKPLDVAGVLKLDDKAKVRTLNGWMLDLITRGISKQLSIPISDKLRREVAARLIRDPVSVSLEAGLEPFTTTTPLDIAVRFVGGMLTLNGVGIVKAVFG